MIKLLIVEDEGGIPETLLDHFQEEGDLARGAATLEEARAALMEGRFTTILLDLMLPDGDGLGPFREVRRRGDTTPIIIMTALGEEEQRVRGLRLGADDYLVKPVSLLELTARIETVLRRSGGAPPQVTIGSAVLHLDAREVHSGGRVQHLSRKEADLLAFFISHPRRALPRTEILRRKIKEIPDDPRHFLTVHGQGYRFAP